MGSGGTHFENAIPELNGIIPAGGKTIGNGSGASNPQAFVFLVTDGADNNQYFTTSPQGWTGSQPKLMDPTLCAQLKNRGITVSVLYIPYPPISPPNPCFANNEDDKVNALVSPSPPQPGPSAQCPAPPPAPPPVPPYIPATLQQCASPGFFYTASTPQDITNAMQDMFAQSLALARLTQ